MRARRPSRRPSRGYLIGYNKRNPKKGIERPHPKTQPASAGRLEVTTKEIPKRELRDHHAITSNCFSCAPPLVTTKEIPKRELRVNAAHHVGVSQVPHCYNKRNPKKGIESRTRGPADPTALDAPVTTKEIPKRELRAADILGYPHDGGLYMLQQKKSQKGN